MAKKKSKTNGKSQRKSFAEALGFKNIFNNERTDFILGLLMFAASVFVTIAMVSFLTTGKGDQSLLENLRPGEWLNTDRQFQNYCASFGAITAYVLMTLNFGLAAFAIPLFFLMVSIRMMGIYRVNLWKWFLALAVIMIWSSVAMAKFLTPLMGDQTFNPGGKHGLFCVQQLENVAGTPGLIAILAVVALVFLVFLSTETINVIRKALNPVKYLTQKIRFTIVSPHSDDNDSDNNVNNGSNDDDDDNNKNENECKDNVASITQVIDTTDFRQDVSKKPTTDKKPANAISDIADDILEVEDIAEVDEAKGKTVAPEVDLSKPINPKEPFTKYKYPTLDLLKKYESDKKPFVDMEEIKANNARIVEVLNSFGVAIKEIKATVGPTITLYEITPAPGVRISRIKTLEEDIALNLAALSTRIIAPIPGKGTIGIEVPNKKPNIVSMESILNSRKFQESEMELPLALGKTITNEVFMVDLAKIPHLLVAGATGQGKSVGLNAIISSLLYKKHPNELKLVLIDPKKVEFGIYSPIADHFMAALPENDEMPIITDVTKVVRTLNSLCALMDRRYDLLKLAGVRNVKEYNAKYTNHELSPTKGHEYMFYIVVIIDEYGDLIMTAGKEIELPIARIAQLARAVGIHMVIATQSPRATIITGKIKANFPGRIAFRVSQGIESQTILDRRGANQLVGRGDMLYLNGSDPIRMQCAFIDTPEVQRICKFIEQQPGPVAPYELPEPVAADGEGGAAGGNMSDMGAIDPLFEEAARTIVTSQQGSTSMIQRRFSIGYNRAGRLMDQLEKAGIVGAAMGSKPRDVLITDENQLNMLLLQMKG